MASIRKRTWKTRAGDQKTAWAVDWADINGGRHRRQFPTKRLADNFRIEIEGQLKAGTFRADADKIAVSDVAEMFLAYCDGRMLRNERMTRGNLANLKSRLRGHVLHPEYGIGALKLSALTTRNIVEFRDRMRDAAVSVAMTRKVISSLHTMLGYCIERDYVATNAARNVRVLGPRDEKVSRVTVPAKADVRALMEVADPDFRIVLMTSVLTGVRASELRALRWRHLDFLKRTVAVETRVDRFRCEDTPKTAAGHRTIPLSDALLSELRKWKLRSRFAGQDDLVFPNRNGSYLDHGNMIRRRFNPLFSAKGVKRFHWHALRHFAVSSWIDAGLSPKAVQTFAGHSSMQMTMDLYGHLFPRDSHTTAMNDIAGSIVPA